MNSKLTYIIFIINAFAKHYKIDMKNSFQYLKKYQGLTFLDEFYEVEHQLSKNDAIDDLTIICKRNGGNLS